jgi:IS1 family transposase
VQRYFCDRCGKSFKESQPLDGLRVDFKQACQVVNLLCESMGIRAISRITGLDTKTILNILENAGQKAEQFLDSQVRNVRAENVQADEIHTFVFSKQQNTLAENYERGDQFTFLAIDTKSKLIINHLVGKRTKMNTNDFCDDLAMRLANRVQLTTDGMSFYTGLGGAVICAFGNDVDYATEIKRFAEPSKFRPLTLAGINRKARIGSPDMSLATTCHAERTNLSVRLFNRRFTRCTLGYSKKLDNLKHATALFIWHFNYCRKHSAHGQTPAQAANLTDHQWKIEDLLSWQN